LSYRLNDSPMYLDSVSLRMPILPDIAERVDDWPTHKWIARFVFPLMLIQRIWFPQFDDIIEVFLLVYLTWLSEITAQESWLARKLEQKKRKESPPRESNPHSLG
jgi:hypothetical protein